MNMIDLQALTLAGTTVTIPVSDPPSCTKAPQPTLYDEMKTI